MQQLSKNDIGCAFIASSHAFNSAHQLTPLMQNVRSVNLQRRQGRLPNHTSTHLVRRKPPHGNIFLK